MTRKTRSATAVAGSAWASALGRHRLCRRQLATAAEQHRRRRQRRPAAAAAAQVKLTFWQNSTTGPGQQFFRTPPRRSTRAPERHDQVQTIQNEDLDGKLQTALNSNSAPDIFLQRGGGKMQAMVNAGQVQAADLTDADKTNAGAAALAAEIDRRQGLRACRSTPSPRASTTARTCSSRPASPRRRRRIDELKARRRQAEGDRRRADRGRRQGRLAGRALVLQLRAARVQPGHDDEHGQVAQVHRPVLDQGRRRPGRVPEGQPVPEGLPDDLRPAGRRLARRAWSRTTRPAWS